MLVRTEPFRDFDRLAQQIWARERALRRCRWMPGVTASRSWCNSTCPGWTRTSVDLDVPRNVLTVRAERRPSPGDDTEMIAAERPRGVLRRQLILADTPTPTGCKPATPPAFSRCASRPPKKPNPSKVAITNTDPDAAANRRLAAPDGQTPRASPKRRR